MRLCSMIPARPYFVLLVPLLQVQTVPVFTQILGFYPQTDSISVNSWDISPGLISHVIDSPNPVDTIEFRPFGSSKMHAGALDGARIYRCYFAVRDTLNQNQYQLYLQLLSQYSGSRTRVPFDTAFYLRYRQDLWLAVHYAGAPGDLAAVRFYDIVTSIESPVAGYVPSAAWLLGNYPNPFNSSTTIRYVLLHSSPVSLVVYNILGQLESQLVSGEQEPGYHEVRFDGSGLPSGVYFCRMSVTPPARRDLVTQERDGQTGEFVQTKKLVLALNATPEQGGG
jgi:hypothetical protein